MRPDIVWFGESLPFDTWSQAQQAASHADVILVIGTSALVYPAAALATSFARNAFVAEINIEQTPISDRVHAILREPAAVALPRIAGALRMSP